MDGKGFVTIKREDLVRLVKASMKLEALEGGGVDNTSIILAKIL